MTQSPISPTPKSTAKPTRPRPIVDTQPEQNQTVKREVKLKQRRIVEGYKQAFGISKSTVANLLWKTESGSPEEKRAIELLVEMKKLHSSIKTGHGADSTIGKMRKHSTDLLGGSELVMVEVFIERATALLAHIREEGDVHGMDISG